VEEIKREGSNPKPGGGGGISYLEWIAPIKDSYCNNGHERNAWKIK
jgi:hypothetical protein